MDDLIIVNQELDFEFCNQDKHFSSSQGVEFYPLCLDDQAYLVDNFPRLMGVMEDMLVSNPDAIYSHWLSRWKEGFSAIQSNCELRVL